MHVTVTSVAMADSRPSIGFLCRYGVGRGIWTVGVPRLDQEYDVEIDIDQSICVGLNTKVTRDETPRINSSEHQVAIIAKIENVFENHTVSLRFGDSLILVEYEGVLPTNGTWVEVTVPQIEISDTGI